jgi:hypothetical protein
MDLSSIILGFAQQNPNIAALLLFMGVARTVFKPLFALAHAYVAATETPDDDAKLAEIEQSKIVKGLEFALDYVASVKLKK